MREAAIDSHRSAPRGGGRPRSAGAPALDDMLGDGPLSRGLPRGPQRGGDTSAAVAAQRLGGGRAGALGRPAAGHGRSGPGALARLGARLPRVRPVKALTIGAFGVALVGIVANAMVFQRGHHPSPLFGLGRSVDGASDQDAQRPAAGSGAALPAPPAPAPIERTGTIVQAPTAEPASPAAPAPKAAPPARHAAKAHRDDPVKARAAEASAPPIAHPRPGHPTPAHARAEAKPDGRAEPKAEAKAEGKSDGRPGVKGDELGKLIAGSAHPAKAKETAAPATHVGAKPEAKVQHKPAVDPAQPDHAAADAPPAHAHHRLTAASQAATPAAKAAAAAQTD